jgi:hypothetical protein
MFTSIITTADRFEEDYIQNGIIMASKGDYKPWQTVVSVGDSVRGIKPGDKVMINFENYVVRKYDKNSIQNDLDNNKKVRYAFNFVTMDDADGKPMECFLFNDRDILYSFEGEEKDDEAAPSVSNIILPKKNKIIL